MADIKSIRNDSPMDVAQYAGTMIYCKLMNSYGATNY
jgi:hypothetical protein